MHRILSSIELFELFYDEEIKEIIVEQSNLYSLSKDWAPLNISTILIVFGYDSNPSKAHYWPASSDLPNTAVYEAIRLYIP